MKQTKVLAINFGGIGDEILFFPTLKTLKASYPDSKLTLVLEPRSKAAEQLTNLIDNTITCDIKGKSKLINVVKMLLKIWFGRYDIVVSSGSGKFVSVLLLLTGVSKKYGYYSGKLSETILTKAIPLNKNQYAANMYHDLTSGINPEAVAEIPEINILPENTAWASEKIGTKDKKVIIIHPGVSRLSVQKGMFKFWTPENWLELVLKLLNSGKYKVILTGGPDDSLVLSKLTQELEKHEFENLVNFYGETKNIAQFAALASLCDVLVCVDSAPMHVGVGVSAKVVAIFGPTDEKKLLPSNDSSSNDSRFIALKNDMECRPCLWEKRQTTCESPECLNVSVDKVFEAISSVS